MDRDDPAYKGQSDYTPLMLRAYDPLVLGHTIRPYPIESKVLTLADLSPAQLAAGQAACSAITDSRLRDQCVFDVAVTGDTGFAGSYAIAQAFMTTPIGPVSFPPASVSPVSTPPAVVSGAVTVTKGTAVGGYAVGPDDTVYLSVQTGDNNYSLISFDPKAGTVLRQVSVPATTDVHYAAGSLWLPGLKDTMLNSCSVSRYDPSTLTEQATISLPCASVTGPLVASDGSALWYEDTTNLDSSTGKGAVVVRIDPQTNKPGTSVPLPSGGGYLIDSQGAIFYTDADTNAYFVLTTGSTASSAFAPLGTFPHVALPSGAGLWTQNGNGQPALYFTHAGSPDHTIEVHGALVGGDASATYTEGQVARASGGTEPALLRNPIDASSFTRIALPPKIGANQPLYTEDPAPTVTADGIVKIWAINSDSPQATILLQWTPLP